MIKDLIKKEINNFLDEEDKRRKEREQINSDPELKKVGIDKNYLQLVENAIAERDIDKAKSLRNELELKITDIQDPTIKDKAAVIGIEINNLIDLEEKIIKNKKDFELRIKNLKGEENKSFFSEDKKKGMDSKEMQKFFEKGIQSNQPKNSFFSSKPDKVTVVQNIITPEQPMPSSVPKQSTQEANQQSLPEQNVQQEQVEQRTQYIQQSNTPPIQIMPEKIRAEIVKNPKEGHEEEFNKATFLVHELSSFLKEKEWRKAKDEYNVARNLIESLPDCEDKESLMNQLFDDYHAINQLEKEWKEEQERLLKKKEEEERLRKQEEQKRKEEEERRLEEQKQKRIREAEEKERLRKEAQIEMQRNAKEHLEKHIIDKEKAELDAEDEKNIKPPIFKTLEKTHSDLQQRLLEAKYDQIVFGGKNTSKFIQIAQESLNHDRALRKPVLNDKKIELPDRPISSNKDPESMYKRAVSLIYEGKKDMAKQLLSEIIKLQPNNIAAQIRLKECES